jgi:hypothetical protein
VLFRPLTKLRVVTAVKNILDPAERTRVDKSGFPDTVVLVQISDAEEDQEVAAASTSKKSKAGASGNSTAASAVIEVESDDSDDEPLTKKPKTSAPTKKPPEPVIPKTLQPAAAKNAKTAASTHPAKTPTMPTATPCVR